MLFQYQIRFSAFDYFTDLVYGGGIRSTLNSVAV